MDTGGPRVESLNFIKRLMQWFVVTVAFAKQRGAFAASWQSHPAVATNSNSWEMTPASRWKKRQLQGQPLQEGNRLYKSPPRINKNKTKTCRIYLKKCRRGDTDIVEKKQILNIHLLYVLDGNVEIVNNWKQNLQTFLRTREMYLI